MKPAPPTRPAAACNRSPCSPGTHGPGEWGAGCAAVCGNAAGVNSPARPACRPAIRLPGARRRTARSHAMGARFTAATGSARSWSRSHAIRPSSNGVCVPPMRLRPARLALAVSGESISRATTPGVVQALGSPLKPGAGVSVTVDGPNTQVLIRAQQGNVVVEDRFAGIATRPGQKLHVTVAEADRVRSSDVLADGHGPVEQRILRSLPVGAAVRLDPDACLPRMCSCDASFALRRPTNQPY